jgi:hypothetical protein
MTLLVVIVLAFVGLAVVSALPPRHGRCMTDLISPHGVVVRELCLFAPGGIVDMIMAIHGERTTTTAGTGTTTTPGQYFELWSNAPAATQMPPVGGMFGHWQLAPGAPSASYNVSLNCAIALVSSALTTPQNRSWTALPDSDVVMNVFADQGVGMLGAATPPAQSVYCSFIPLFGAECDAALDRLLQTLALATPPKKLSIDRQSACYPQ